MKNIELLELQGKLQNPIMEFILDKEDFLLEKGEIDEMLSKGESGLQDLRLILKAYNRHHLKYQNYFEVEDYGNIYNISHVIAALAYLEDEESFDDMMEYIYTSPELIDAIWADDFFEAFPLYYSKFPNKIDSIKEALYDPKLVIDMKRILALSLAVFTNLKNPALTKKIANIFSEYLQFLLIPENRLTQDNCYEPWLDLNDLFDSVLEGYLDCEGDYRNPLVQQAVKERLVDEDEFSIENIANWEIFIFPLRTIYVSTKFWKDIEEVSGLSERDNRVQRMQHYEQELKEVIKISKQFHSIFDESDRIAVKYKADGNILRNIKFKKVEQDLIDGKCEVI